MSDVCGRPIRYPLILFFFVAVLSFTITGKMLTYWESRLECGAQAFSGTVIDAGVGIPGCPEKGRWQIVLLSDGVPAMLWMNEPGGSGIESGCGLFQTCGRMKSWRFQRGCGFGRTESRIPQLVTMRSNVEHLSGDSTLPDAFRDSVRLVIQDNTSGGPVGISYTGISSMSDMERYHLRVSGLSHLTSVSERISTPRSISS